MRNRAPAFVDNNNVFSLNYVVTSGIRLFYRIIYVISLINENRILTCNLSRCLRHYTSIWCYLLLIF